MKREWSIEVAHYDLGIPYADNILFLGKNASHSFLRLKDENGATQQEIHGGAFNLKNNSFAAYRFKLSDMFNNKSKCQTSDFLLRAEVRNTQTTKNIDHLDKIITGNKDEVTKVWQVACEKVTEINAANLRYIAITGARRAQNCHSVVNTLCKHMGYPYAVCHRSHPFALPGVKNCLEKVIETLKSPKAENTVKKARRKILDKAASIFQQARMRPRN